MEQNVSDPLRTFFCAFVCIWNELDTVAEGRGQGAQRYQGLYAMLWCMIQNNHHILHLDAVVKPLSSVENLQGSASNQ